MYSFRKFLSEKRAHADLNQKISVYDQLKQYKGQSDIFVSFTEIEKIGINPRSNYSTPNGIYTYPIDYILDNVRENSVSGAVRINVPFAGDKPNIFVVKNKRPDSTLFISDFNQADYEHYLKAIREIYKNKNNEKLDKNNLPPNIKGLIDFINDESNSKYDREEYQHMLDASTNWIEWLIWYATNNSRKKTFVSKFWNITRLLAIEPTPKNEGRQRKAAAMNWNNVLRKLGITGVVDEGNGVIHPAEPTQAVFFDKSTLQIVDKINNTRDIGKEISALGDLLRIVFELKWLRGNIVETESFRLSRDATRLKFSDQDIMNAVKLLRGREISLSGFSDVRILNQIIVNTRKNNGDKIAQSLLKAIVMNVGKTTMLSADLISNWELT